ncbi:HAD family hydrolase [Pyrobaculum neutrophilum]|uniref:Haloacid dehalogenase domain protein hydrolase n=1 Tax=Pyrobaculum neutrophilum (strain DSM 2338 / JCM 9278 / NBRC 100436 / V24Sta) TaxID=444157 RepID=B1Y9E8_PYRNV|nr:HAD family hydrolase [Pyrobaculum neutrophilum]ACB40377.1 Haloacid dehalogenase domain protein hydrolase [Pyrobaculum neutrophilum V24Sta]
MIFILSFWGLLAERVDFWEVWRNVLGRRDLVEEVSWFVEEVNAAGYEVPLQAVARLFAKRAGGDPRELAGRFVEEVSARLAPRPCAVDFLRWLRGRWRFAVLSNTPCRCFPRLFLERWGVEADLVATSDVLLRRKPSKAVFRYVLGRLGVEPHEAVYVGDGEEDLGAMGLGLFTIMVGSRGGHLDFPTLCEAWSWVRANLAKS